MTSISSNAGIAAAVRASLKFDPQESVALMLCTEGAVLATLRVDLVADGQVAHWINAIRGILGKVSAGNAIDATILVAYDERGQLKGTQYDALEDLLMEVGAPIRRAVLVANGQIQDFHGDGTDAVPYAEVEAEAITLEHRLIGKNPLRAKDIEHCEESSIEVQAIAGARVAEIRNMGTDLAEIAPKIGHEMAVQIAIYREAGEVTEEVAGWLAGTFHVKAGRDLAVMSRDVVESVEGYAANRRVVSVVVVEVEPAGQRQASFGL